MTPDPSGACFIDSTVVLLAAGGPHPARAACAALLTSAATGELTLHASVEMIQEFVFHRMRRERSASAAERMTVLGESLVLHPFDSDVLRDSLELIRTGSVRGRDAVHAATALAAGFDAIVSTDTDVDGISGLRRIDPTELVLR